MAIVITYDISSKHVAFKEAMFELGYTSKIVHDGKWIYFPNTTLYHQTKTSLQSVNDAQRIAKQLSVNLERCVATQWGPDWSAIWGEPFN